MEGFAAYVHLLNMFTCSLIEEWGVANLCCISIPSACKKVLDYFLLTIVPELPVTFFVKRSNWSYTHPFSSLSSNLVEDELDGCQGFYFAHWQLWWLSSLSFEKL